VQAIHWFLIGAAVLAAGALGAAATHWQARQKLANLQQRLLRSEEARNGAIEHSARAREQIAQLSKAITDLRRLHQPARSGPPQEEAIAAAETRRANAERALLAAAAADGKDDEAASSSKGGVMLFANTEPMEL
jgi:hypothetical protein